jgi:hypothetical protein
MVILLSGEDCPGGLDTNDAGSAVMRENATANVQVAGQVVQPRDGVELDHGGVGSYLGKY